MTKRRSRELLAQKIYFNASCNWRMEVAVPLMTPKPWCALVAGWPGKAAPARMFPLGADHTGWFSALKASKRNCKRCCS